MSLAIKIHLKVSMNLKKENLIKIQIQISNFSEKIITL